MSRSRDLANLAGDATGLETLTVSDITDLTATATELNYVDGVGSALQTQIDAKAPTASPTFTGTTNVSSGVTLPSLHVIQTQFNQFTGSQAFNDNYHNTVNNGGINDSGSQANGVDMVSKTITPTAGSDLVIWVTTAFQHLSGSTGDHSTQTRLYKGTSQLKAVNWHFNNWYDMQEGVGNFFFIEENQTGQRTYTVNMNHNKNNMQCDSASIVIMEIK